MTVDMLAKVIVDTFAGSCRDILSVDTVLYKKKPTNKYSGTLRTGSA